MVKALIQGILGKKGEEAKAPAKEAEVPDELPPLAQDVIENSAPKPEKSDVPEELPELIAKAPETPSATPPDQLSGASSPGTLKDLETEHIPDAIKAAKLAKMKFQDNVQLDALDDIPSELPSPKPDSALMTTSERIKEGGELGFFSSLLDHLKKHGGSKDNLLAGDLFSRMGSYWEIRKHEIRSGAPLPVEKKLEGDMLRKLEELRTLEQKWQIQKLALEEDLKFIHEREIEIQSKIHELEMTSNELRLFKNVKPEEYFYLENGLLLKNLHDLIDVLEILDESTFRAHVNESKNDFSNWVRHVFKDTRLSDKLKASKSRIEMIEVLESIPTMGEETARKHSYAVSNPKKYFWLDNGVAIRNIHELLDALKTIDESSFSRHVGNSNNDFSKWVGDVLRNEPLAGKLDRAKTRKDMVGILEAYI